MKIATWNVNSLRARLPLVLGWLESSRPDVVLLQETKCQDHDFPREPIEDLGYNLAIFGQKTYNGVAILSKLPIEDVMMGLPGDETDTQARYIEAVVGTTRVASVYVPNGATVDSPSFQYKLKFLDRLNAHMKDRLSFGEFFWIGGDYNIAPDDLDVFDPLKARGDVMFTDIEHRAWRDLLNLGYTDALRYLFPETPELYTWWDYRTHSFRGNRGWRIDHFLGSPEALKTLKDSGIDVEPRGLERPSDHTPVWIKTSL
jgi:exodeoxyribonuclease-3